MAGSKAQIVRALQGHGKFGRVPLMMLAHRSLLAGALALPAYQDYSIRARVSEMLLAAGGCKTAVNEAISSASQPDVSGALPKACENQSSKYVSSISADAAPGSTGKGEEFMRHSLGPRHCGRR